MKTLPLAALATTATARSLNTTFSWNGTFTYAPTAGTGTGHHTIGANATSCNATIPQPEVSTTVWTPTMETIKTTVYVPFSSTQGAPIEASSAIPSVSVSIETETISYTVTVTVTPSPSSSQSGQFSYVVNSGTTSWLNGNTPDPNQPLTYATSSLTVVPVLSTPSEQDTFTTIRSTSTISNFVTVTPPASTEAPAPLSTLSAPPVSLTTTSYSPELTTTLFSTHYSTQTVSRVSTPSSFSGMNTNGWNATSTQPAPEQSQPSPLPITTTETEVVVLNMTSTAATTTLYLTTTIGATITQTIYPSQVISGTAGSAFTGEPVTLTHTVQSEGPYLSTSLPLSEPSSASVSAASGSVSITSTITAAAPPVSSPTDESTLASAGAASSNSASPVMASSSSSTTSTSTTSSPSWTIITLTTFVSGHGTTITANSTTIGTTPFSPGFNSTSTSTTPASTRTFTVTTSSVSGQLTTITLTSTPAATPPMSPGFNSTTRVGSQGPMESSNIPSAHSASPISSSTLPQSQSASSHPAAASTVSSSTSGQAPSSSVLPSAASPTSTDPSHTTPTTALTPSQSTSSHTSHHSSSSSVLASSNGTSTRPTSRPVSRTTSSSSFSNPFPPHSATATPSAGCGEQGNFTMTFDDLPRWTPSKRQSWNNSANATDLGQYPPVTFNYRPYHHLYFSDGYVYAPQPAEPYSPASSPNVAAFADPMRTGYKRNSTGKNNVEPGEVGGADRDDSPAFWFDVDSAHLGCDNPGPDDCIIEATGYAWDPEADDEMPKASHNYTIPPCSRHCQMEQVDFSYAFRNLSGIQFRAMVENESRTFYLDNLNMRWSNSSCSAGMTRQGAR